MFFEAVDPRRLPDMLKEKERKIKEVLPGLLALRATATEKPSLHLFEGLKGIYSLINQIYEEKDLLQYGSARIGKAMLPSIPESFARRRVEQGITLRAIFERSAEALFRVEDPEIAKVTKLRFIDSFASMPTITMIAGDKVATLSLGGDLLGVLIEDKEIAQTQRMIFELLWKQAKD
jgi:sugar-specific transcriptional regulator TrmB